MTPGVLIPIPRDTWARRARAVRAYLQAERFAEDGSLAGVPLEIVKEAVADWELYPRCWRDALAGRRG